MNANLKIECFKMITFKIVIFRSKLSPEYNIIYKLRVQSAVI